MNKYTLNVPYDKKDLAKSAGAVWQSYNKKWTLFGDGLPAALDQFREREDLNIENTCNTCLCQFNEHVLRQSSKNVRYLATIVRGAVVQECCESCAQECESAIDQ